MYNEEVSACRHEFYNYNVIVQVNFSTIIVCPKLRTLPINTTIFSNPILYSFNSLLLALVKMYHTHSYNFAHQY